MKKEKAHISITLLLISKGSPLNNSYKIIQFIERKLRTMESNYIMDKIEQDGFVNFEIINGVHYYALTNLGKEFISNEYDSAKAFLLEEYPSEKEIISALFDSYEK